MAGSGVQGVTIYLRRTSEQGVAGRLSLNILIIVLGGGEHGIPCLGHT